MALMTYLLKDRHGTYYFLRVIPPDLRPFVPPPWAAQGELQAVPWNEEALSRKD